MDEALQLYTTLFKQAHGLIHEPVLNKTAAGFGVFKRVFKRLIPKTKASAAEAAFQTSVKGADEFSDAVRLASSDAVNKASASGKRALIGGAGIGAAGLVGGTMYGDIKAQERESSALRKGRIEGAAAGAAAGLIAPKLLRSAPVQKFMQGPTTQEGYQYV